MVIQRGGNLDEHLAHEVLLHGDVAADELLHLTAGYIVEGEYHGYIAEGEYDGYTKGW